MITCRMNVLERLTSLTSCLFTLGASVYANASADEPHAYSPRHYQTFPKSIVPIFAASNTRQLQLRFNQGWWDTESWGKLPHDGKHSGGTGIDLAAVIEGSSLDEARASWVRLALSLSGFFCALLNFVDDSLTTFPRHDISDIGDDYVTSANHSLFLMRAALPEEPVCTENLTPFLKLLPTRGKAGIASLLDGHKLYDSLWHSMSIEMATQCVENQCRLHLYQNIDHIIDISRLLRRAHMDNFLKPTPSDELDAEDDLVVFEAVALSDGPRATVRLPDRVPHGFHGVWVPGIDPG